MFTGIIQHTGTIDAFEKRANGARLTIRTTDSDLFTRGESLAVNGVCLTVLPERNGSLIADVSDETLSRTTLGALGTGTRINTERALAIGDRLGGHIVQGHVDGVGMLVSVATEGDFAVYRWRYPAEFGPLLVSKGSVAVDGVSLTVIEPDAETFGAALIPETLSRTNLGTARPGDPVNLEFDMIAKYIRELVTPYLPK
jgi:riboflavin synthase